MKMRLNLEEYRKKLDERIPVIIAVTQGISGVMSWALRLRKAFKNHPKYKIILLGCRVEPDRNKDFDLCAPTWGTAYELLNMMESAIVVPNFIFDLFPICAELISMGKNIRCIGFCRADSEEEYYNPLCWYEPLISTFIAVSPECACKLTKRISFRVQDVVILPAGVFIPKKLKRKYQNNPIRIVYGGRIVQKQKRVMDFIPLVKKLLELNIDFIFNIVGGGSQLISLKEAMLKIEHHGRVCFLDRVTPESMEKIWSDHDIFIQTSDFEGTSNSMLEAMAQGTIPIVTKTNSGVNGVIKHGKNGFLISLKDMEAMANAIGDLACQPYKMEKIGKAAYKTSKNFSMESYIEKFTNILDKTIFSPVRFWPDKKNIEPQIKTLFLRLPKVNLNNKQIL